MAIPVHSGHRLSCPGTVFAAFKNQQYFGSSTDAFTVRNSHWREVRASQPGSSFFSWRNIFIATGLLAGGALLCTILWPIIKNTALFKKVVKLKQLADVGAKVVDIGKTVTNKITFLKEKVGSTGKAVTGFLGKTARFLKLDKIASWFRRK